ncbi:MAG TPA: molybdate ABC transporter substrate-binding protein [Pseudogracilibacillus sp.]|nr:molybdate ABC transporter substrate-binding protein [Pseudogracilibacillus sp.]
MKQTTKFFCTFIILIITLGCSSEDNSNDTIETKDKHEQVEIFVSAAASLTEAMEEIKKLYEAENEVELILNFGGSGKLAQQIQQGAPVDVFISANENWMDTLVQEELIKEDTRTDITGNKLVLITSKDSDIDYSSFEDIESNDVKQIAIGNPESVPAGEYTETVLKAIDQWDNLENQFVFAQDVRQVLTYVETGNSEIGFVYESDTMTSDGVKVLATADHTMHEKIVYPGAITVDSDYEEEGNQFLQFLLSETGQEILRKYGFSK